MKETDPVLDPSRVAQLLRVSIDPIRLRQIVAGTPASLVPIAHYAACWGISDDGYRENLMASASRDARENLKYAVSLHECQLEEWLKGSEANGPDFSEAYVAFSSMVMASDAI